MKSKIKFDESFLEADSVIEIEDLWAKLVSLGLKIECLQWKISTEFFFLKREEN